MTISKISAILLLCLLSACSAPIVGRDAELPPADGGSPYDAEVVLTDTDAGRTPDASTIPPDGSVNPDAPEDTNLDTPDGFARAAARRLCAAWEACADCTRPSAGCVDFQTLRILDFERESDFHADRVEAYLALLDDAYGDCQQITSAEFSRLFPYYGAGAPGEPGPVGTMPIEYGTPCVDHRDCSTRNCQGPYTFPDTSTRSMCVPYPASSPREALCD